MLYKLFFCQPMLLAPLENYPPCILRSFYACLEQLNLNLFFFNNLYLFLLILRTIINILRFLVHIWLCTLIWSLIFCVALDYWSVGMLEDSRMHLFFGFSSFEPQFSLVCLCSPWCSLQLLLFGLGCPQLSYMYLTQ